MGLLFGDVLATIAIILFSGLAAWAGGLLAALLFPERTQQVSLDFEHRPLGTFFLGLGLILCAVLIGTVLYSVPALRVIGVAVFAATLGTALFGTGGLFRLISRRVRSVGGAKSEYESLAKAGVLVIAAELLPVFGWFLLMPFVLIASFGAACKNTLFSRKSRRAEAPPQVEPQ